MPQTPYLLILRHLRRRCFGRYTPEGYIAVDRFGRLVFCLCGNSGLSLTGRLGCFRWLLLVYKANGLGDVRNLGKRGRTLCEWRGGPGCFQELISNDREMGGSSCWRKLASVDSPLNCWLVSSNQGCGSI